MISQLLLGLGVENFALARKCHCAFLVALNFFTSLFLLICEFFRAAGDRLLLGNPLLDQLLLRLLMDVALNFFIRGAKQFLELRGPCSSSLSSFIVDPFLELCGNLLAHFVLGQDLLLVPNLVGFQINHLVDSLVDLLFVLHSPDLFLLLGPLVLRLSGYFNLLHFSVLQLLLPLKTLLLIDLRLLVETGCVLFHTAFSFVDVVR